MKLWNKTVHIYRNTKHGFKRGYSNTGINKQICFAVKWYVFKFERHIQSDQFRYLYLIIMTFFTFNGSVNVIQSVKSDSQHSVKTMQVLSELKLVKLGRRCYLPHYWLDMVKCLKSKIVNRTRHSANEESLKIGTIELLNILTKHYLCCGASKRGIRKVSLLGTLGGEGPWGWRGKY